MRGSLLLLVDSRLARRSAKGAGEIGEAKVEASEANKATLGMMGRDLIAMVVRGRGVEQ